MIKLIFASNILSNDGSSNISITGQTMDRITVK